LGFHSLEVALITIDSLAVSLLLGLSSVLGVRSIPAPVNDWKILKSWTDVDGVQTSSISSNSIIEACKMSPTAFIQVPIIIHGAHDIFLDDQKLLSFGDRYFKSNRSFYGAPIVNCGEVVAGKKFTWVAYSYTKYFARINAYPKIVNNKPISNLVNEILNVIAAGSLIILSVFGFIIAYGKIPHNLIFSFFGSNLVLSGYFFFSTISFFGLQQSMLVSHRLADLFAMIGLLLLLNTLRVLKIISYRMMWACSPFFLTACGIIILANTGDTIQFGTSFPFAIILFALLYGLISQIRALIRTPDRFRVDVLKVIGLGVWVMSVMNDILVVTGLLDGYMLMSVGSLGGFVFFGLSLNEQIMEAYKDRDYLRSSLEKEVEKKTAELRAKTAQLELAMRDVKRVQEELFITTSQVVHDIRSPLAALKVISYDISELPEDKRLVLRTAIDRVNDIANTLAYRRTPLQDEAKLPSRARQVILMSRIVEKVVTEKRVQFRPKMGIDIHAKLGHDSYGLFAEVNETGLERVISNLINNAVESLDKPGQVVIELVHDSQWIVLKITDNGQGIPAEILPQLGARGATFRKDGGTGLGLYHARTELENWKGSMKIESRVGIGTTVTISLPKATPPCWFVEKVFLTSGRQVVVLDDDLNIHNLWEKRFVDLFGSNHGIKVVHLSNPDQLEDFLRLGKSKEMCLYLIDYEFAGTRVSGLELIQKFRLEQLAILVTSRSEDKEVLSFCERFGIRLIPKGMVGFVPIELRERA